MPTSRWFSRAYPTNSAAGPTAFSRGEGRGRQREPQLALKRLVVGVQRAVQQPVQQRRAFGRYRRRWTLITASIKAALAAA